MYSARIEWWDPVPPFGRLFSKIKGAINAEYIFYPRRCYIAKVLGAGGGGATKYCINTLFLAKVVELTDVNC